MVTPQRSEDTSGLQKPSGILQITSLKLQSTFISNFNQTSGDFRPTSSGSEPRAHRAPGSGRTAPRPPPSAARSSFFPLHFISTFFSEKRVFHRRHRTHTIPHKMRDPTETSVSQATSDRSQGPFSHLQANFSETSFQTSAKLQVTSFKLQATQTHLSAGSRYMYI